MDLMTTQANRPVLDRLQGLADELGERDVLGLAISEIRRDTRRRLRETRHQFGELLDAQGVHSWVADPGAATSAYVPVAVRCRSSDGNAVQNDAKRHGHEVLVRRSPSGARQATQGRPRRRPGGRPSRADRRDGLLAGGLTWRHGSQALAPALECGPGCLTGQGHSASSTKPSRPPASEPEAVKAMSSPALPAPENGAKRPESIASRGRLELLLETRPRPVRFLLHARSARCMAWPVDSQQ